MKGFIKRAQVSPVKKADSDSDDDGAPKDPNGDFDYGNYEEEVVPIAAKPFLFGPVDNM